MDEKEKKDRLDKIAELMAKEKLTSEDKQFAFEELNAIIKEYPTDVDVLFWFGMYYQDKREFRTAIAYYKKILEYNPSSDTANIAQDCIKDCRESIRLDKLIEDSNNNKQSSDSFLDKAPDLLEKLSPKWLVISKLIILLVLVIVYCPALIFGVNDRKVVKDTQYYNVIKQVNESQQQDINKPLANEQTKGYQALKVNPTQSYNYFSKKEIYNLRKKYVQSSLFATANYEPNESIFGGIVDKKPWWTIRPCSKLNYKGDYHERIEGDSKLSAQINNPNALVGLSLAFSPWEYEGNMEFCNSRYGDFVPSSLSYNKDENIIVATYKVPSNYPEYKSNVNGRTYGYPIQLSGLNALDFGYNYVYAIETKGINIMYPESSNMKTDIQTFRDYIHLGSSCRYAGGCNNISPMQNNLMFYVDYLPATITLKLWKKQPLNKSVKADFYYKIIIDD